MQADTEWMLVLYICISVKKIMAKKIQRRLLARFNRKIARVQARKFNPPVRGLKKQLQDLNRPVLAALEAKLSAA